MAKNKQSALAAKTKKISAVKQEELKVPTNQKLTQRTWAGLIYTAISALIIVGGTYLAVRWANGDFRVSQTEGSISSETGLLSANSSPTGASVYIDGKLITATDDVIYLDPGTYEVKIVKDGYNTWQKTITIEKSLVAQTDALLIPTTPTLSALTYTGAENLSVSPDGLKIVFYTASASAKSKNGLYLLDLNSGLLSSEPKLPSQITDDDADYDLAKAKIIWSPDSNQILLKTEDDTFLLSVYEMSNLASQPDASLKVKTILEEWQADMITREQQFLNQYPEEILQIATESAQNVYLAPSKKKMLYTATETAVLPADLIAAPTVVNSQAEERNLVAGGIYIYDLVEDRNYLIGQVESTTDPAKTLLSREFGTNGRDLTKEMINDLIDNQDFSRTVENFKTYHSSLYTNTYQWLADSKNLIYSQKDGSVRVVSYDGTNGAVIYSGNLAEDFLYPWPDGSKLLILTSFSPNSPNNIYAIDLKK